MWPSLDCKEDWRIIFDPYFSIAPLSVVHCFVEGLYESSTPFSDTLCSPCIITIHIDELVVNFNGETCFAHKN